MFPSSVIAASNSRLPEERISGYALIGPDVVLGDDGRRAYGPVPPDADGAYITVTRSGTTATVGTDASGYARLFVYEHADHWAIGSSLLELAQWVHEARWHLDGDPDQVSVFLFENAIGNQLVSERTAFRQIRLVPLGARVTITSGRRRRYRVDPPVAVPAWSSFGGMLRQGLWEVASRARTLIHSGIPLVADVDGGRDFRVVLAALLAGNDTGRPIGELVRFRCDRNRPEVFAAAQALDAEYDLRLNRRTGIARSPIDPDHGFSEWRRNDLGVYGPIYPYRSSNGEFQISGAGGEAHRRIYKSPSMPAVLAQAIPAEVPPSAMASLTAAMNASLELTVRGRVDPRVHHFSEYRERLHGGRLALRQPIFAPLADGVLRRASRLRDPSGELGAQITVDVIRNLAPDLLAIPLEPGSKHFPKRQVSGATTVSLKPVATGTVFGTMPEAPATNPAQHRQVLDPFRSAFVEAARRVRIAGTLPESVVDRAAAVLEQSADRDRLPHAADGKAVAAVLLAGEVDRLT